MRYSNDHKSSTRDRIVRRAAEQLRAAGLNGIGVADLMKGAGLTHGGFYSHFASKDALVAEAIDAAFQQTLEQLSDVAARAGRGNRSRAIRHHYLTAVHRDNADKGCAIAALGSDIGRLQTDARQHFEKNVKALLELIAGENDTAANQKEAIRTLAAMVGALVLARAVRSKTLSNRILEAVRTG